VNLVIQDHEHLQPLPPPTKPIAQLVAATERLVEKALADLADLSANAALAPECTKLQQLCNDITGAATAISLDMKVTGATVVQCLQDAEDINDALVVKLAFLGIRVAELQLQSNQLETQRVELWRQANDLAITEWRNAVTAKRKEVTPNRDRFQKLLEQHVYFSGATFPDRRCTCSDGGRPRPRRARDRPSTCGARSSIGTSSKR